VSDVPYRPEVLQTWHSGIAGLTVEVDASCSVLLVSRDIEGRARATYTVTNSPGFHEALDAAIAFRNDMESVDRQAAGNGPSSTLPGTPSVGDQDE